MYTLLVVVIIGSYLVGAVPFGWLVCRWAKGIDIREHGSGNIGATNVARVLGGMGFAVVFALDVLKGAVPTLAVLLYCYFTRDGFLYRFLRDGLMLYDLPTLAGLSAILGHMFPIYLQFRGGKGVATSAGVLLVLAWLPALVAAAVWIGVALVTRYVSVASVAAALALCVARLGQVWGEGYRHDERAITLLCLVGAILVTYQHRGNFVRLWQGKEPKIGERVEVQAA